jgi:hypothetical protein
MIRKNTNFQLINEHFPHIGTKIFYLWSTDALSSYLNELMTDTRDGERQGFPAEIAKAIFRLQQEHDSLFPRAVLKVAGVRSQHTYEQEAHPTRFTDRTAVRW